MAMTKMNRITLNQSISRAMLRILLRCLGMLAPVCGVKKTPAKRCGGWFVVFVGSGS